MAGNGPPPKENRRRQERDVYSDVKVHIEPKSSQLRGPTLLSASGGVSATWDEPLAGLVAAWWRTWRSSPQADAFLATDWSRLSMLIPLVASYFARPHYTKLAEIRQSESLLGATHVDRLKARIKVERPQVEVPVDPSVAVLNEYRQRLAG